MKENLIFFLVFISLIGGADLVRSEQVRTENQLEKCKKLARDYWERELYEKSEEEYKKALELAPEDEEVIIGLGMVYHAQGKIFDAIRWYEKALELNPKSARALNNIGDAYMRMGKFKEAKEMVKKALEIQPNFRIAYITMGEIYEKLGEYEKALDSFKKARELPKYKEYVEEKIKEMEVLLKFE